ncbi:protein kinase domain-containing protein [Cryobacterium melibiosiphilum]|uniref:protein kinase domain-containing protein n=1 Tax=Cryobacterium melibiosiphilum TaxID=995039 RepID=UPI001314AD71|nr:hypothetical protein [Cryobacterium melibiosiphilum]
MPVPDSPAGLSIPADIAGYAVVRRLGEGRHSDTYLGHSAASGSGQVALKVFRADTDAAAIERQITALAVARPGLPHLIDVASLPDGRVCVVLERLQGDSLAHYLTRYGPLGAGEAVTILAPVVVALRSLHEADLVHTGLSQASIVIAAQGRPVLLGLGSLGTLPSTGADRVALLRADYGRLAVLVTGVLDELGQDQARFAGRTALVALIDAAVRATPFMPCLLQLERHFFDWAPATALSYGRNAAPDSPRCDGARTGGPRPDPPGLSTTTDAVPRPTGFDEAVRGLGLAADAAEHLRVFMVVGQQLRFRLSAQLARPWRWVTGKVRREPRSRQRHRTRVVYAASVATAATVAALVLLPSAAPEATDPTVPPPPAATVPVAPASDAVALTSDDPVAAVRVLLTLRAQCLSAASVACLDSTDQASGPLLAADIQLISTAETIAAFTLGSDGTAELVERTGNSALIALGPGSAVAGPAGDGLGHEKSQPASALIIKGEAGWRLRELFDY